MFITGHAVSDRTFRGRSAVAIASTAIIIALSAGTAPAHATVYAGGNASTTYKISTQSQVTTDQDDHEQGAATATAGASTATGTLSYSTIIDDGHGNYIPFTYTGQASGSFAANATYGTLHASANAGYGLVPGSVNVIGYDSSGNPYYSANGNPIALIGSGHGYATLEDRFTVTSTTLTDGTPVKIRITMSFDAGGDGGVAELSANLRNGPYGGPFFGGGGGSLYMEADNDGAQSGTKSVDLTVYVGRSQYLLASLAVAATVPFGVCEGSNYPSGYDLCAGQDAYEDAHDTAHLFVDAVDPGFSLAFDSGHDYGTPTTAPVPEPGSLALFGGALLGLGFMRRRRAAAG